MFSYVIQSEVISALYLTISPIDNSNTVVSKNSLRIYANFFLLVISVLKLQRKESRRVVLPRTCCLILQHANCIGECDESNCFQTQGVAGLLNRWKNTTLLVLRDYLKYFCTNCYVTKKLRILILIKYFLAFRFLQIILLEYFPTLCLLSLRVVGL
jgi:antibiotic biosynthesis monooxygenase (ABM) superfamily enzyme